MEGRVVYGGTIPWTVTGDAADRMIKFRATNDSVAVNRLHQDAAVGGEEVGQGFGDLSAFRLGTVAQQVGHGGAVNRPAGILEVIHQPPGLQTIPRQAQIGADPRLEGTVGRDQPIGVAVAGDAVEFGEQCQPASYGLFRAARPTFVTAKARRTVVGIAEDGLGLGLFILKGILVVLKTQRVRSHLA